MLLFESFLIQSYLIIMFLKILFEFTEIKHENVVEDSFSIVKFNFIAVLFSKL